MKLIVLFFSFTFFVSCFDIITVKHEITNNYFVAEDPGSTRPTLYLNIGDGNSIGRVSNVLKAGHIKNIIIAETNEGFYFFDSDKDNKFFNADEIIGRVKTQKDFQNLLDSMKVKEFDFDFYEPK